jgi:hypothetical protein
MIAYFMINIITFRCWLSPDYGIRWAFIGPVLVVIMVGSLIIVKLISLITLFMIVTANIIFIFFIIYSQTTILGAVSQ